MTDSASLPPADDRPPLTEEELVKIETSKGCCPCAPRLVADLRAARVEIANLRRQLATLENHHADMHDEDEDG